MHSAILLPILYVSTQVEANTLRRDDTLIPPNTNTAPATTPNASELVAAYNEGLALSGSPPEPGNVTDAAIRLVNFDGCSDMPGVPNARAQIYSGWQQAQKIMQLPDLINGDVDFNSAAALEYLGPSGLTAARHNDMNIIFRRFASLKPATWPFGWRIHVRCDDPLTLCTCGVSDTLRAYTTTEDLESKLARINFCPEYFKVPSLDSVLKASKTLPDNQKYDMDRYWDTQGHVWAHETMHIDWVTGAQNLPRWNYGHNKHVRDIFMKYKLAGKNKVNERIVRRPTLSKILARWPVNTGDYTIQNADNLALFMTAQYVQSQLGNAYPYLPVTTVEKPDEVDTFNNGVFILEDDGSLALNDTSPLVAADVNASGSPCVMDEDDEDQDPVMLSTLAPDSAYPTEYISSRNAWLASFTKAPEPAATAPPASPPPRPPKAADKCGDWYKFFFDHFEIYGKDFDAAKFGHDGSGLKDQIKGCGDLTQWSFKYLQNDPDGMQWFATGDLPVGTKACVGRAVVSAGGSGPDGCTGAG